MNEPVLQLKDLRRVYVQGTRKVDVLDNASASIYPGEAVALVGPSGSGKSTFLHIAGLLEKPDAGTIILTGLDCASLSDGRRTELRREKIGFIYQFHQLLPEFSALENVIIPQLIAGKAKAAAKARATDLLEDLGLGERTEHRPAELSGGEQQRVAIARAIANKPNILLADEPTGSLDPHSATRVFEQLVKLVHDGRLATIMATHNMDLAKSMDRIIRLEDGQLIEE
jgi:lipoprotein-releasing system ATP-binding protein